MPEKKEYDFLIDNRDVCNENSDMNYVCNKNGVLKDKYYKTKYQMDTMSEKYEDMNLMYGRELIGTINMGLGISLIILYLYYNK